MPQSNQASAPPSRASTPDDDDRPIHSNDQKKCKYSKKSKLSNFPDRIGEVASATIPRFLSTVLTEGLYEDLEVFRSWASDAYWDTWALEAPEDEYEPPLKAVLTIMTRRASWIRTKVRERVEVVVQYAFRFRNPAIQRSDIKHNRRLAEKLAPNVFHCKEHKPDANQDKHPVFIRAVCAALFWDPASIGVVYHEKFNPVPIPAVALVLMMMQVCIEEWAIRPSALTWRVPESSRVMQETSLPGDSHRAPASGREQWGPNKATLP
ncbi:hypothetical protein FRC08_007952 [Ceratobasidium sp. 394]|nr:hypothetical protein FRC08_007952 [Ceratobasidium sp. 394]